VTGQALPAGNDLDNITRGHPAIFRRGDGHIAVANSAAFALSGVSSKPNGCAGRVFKEMASHLRYRGNVTGGWRRETSLCRQSFVPIFLVLHDRRVGLHLVLVKNALRAISSLLFKLLRMTLAFLCLEVIYCRQWKRIPLAGWKSGALLLTLAVQAVLATAFAFTIQELVPASSGAYAFLILSGVLTAELPRLCLHQRLITCELRLTNVAALSIAITGPIRATSFWLY
jgi:hypothetical protein